MVFISQRLRKGRQSYLCRRTSNLDSQPDDNTGETAGGGVNIFKVLMRDEHLVLGGRVT